MQEYDLIIVGAGAAGLGLGSRLEGFGILILDSKSRLGKPGCTGLVTRNLLRFIPKLDPQLILNEVSQCILNYPGGNLHLSSPQKLLVLDRVGFDQWLSQQLPSEARIILRTRMLDFSSDSGGFEIKTNRGILRSRILVGADGANSKVAKILKFHSGSLMLKSLQARIKSNFDPETVEIHLDPRISSSFFGWVVPEDSKISRVGIADSGNLGPKWRYFLRSRFGANPRILGIWGGALRLGLASRASAPGLILVGDAASQSKPLTGGGLVYSQLCAKIAADVICRSLQESNPDLIMEYESRWRRILEPRIKFWRLISKFRRIPLLGFSIPLLKISGMRFNLVQMLGSRLDLDFVLGI